MPTRVYSSTPNIPSQIWMPGSDATICVYWDSIGTHKYNIALQLMDRALVPPGDSGLIVQTSLSSPERVQVPFSLMDAHSCTRVLSGRFVLRPDAHDVIQLWLLDARYPGGSTQEAQISGPIA